MENFENDNSYQKAKEQVSEIRAFYTTLISYAIVISLLAAVNYYFDGWEYPWFLWPAFGWGIGLYFQASSAYRWNLFMGRDWEERKIREFMEREQRGKGNMGRWE